MKFIVQSTKLNNGGANWRELERFEKECQKEKVVNCFGEIETVYVKDFKSLEELVSFCNEEANLKEVIINTEKYDLPVVEIYNDWRE